MVEGEEAALHVGAWISGAYADRLHVEVITFWILENLPNMIHCLYICLSSDHKHKDIM